MTSDGRRGIDEVERPTLRSPWNLMTVPFALLGLALVSMLLVPENLVGDLLFVLAALVVLAYGLRGLLMGVEVSDQLVYRGLFQTLRISWSSIHQVSVEEVDGGFLYTVFAPCLEIEGKDGTSDQMVLRVLCRYTKPFGTPRSPAVERQAATIEQARQSRSASS